MHEHKQSWNQYLTNTRMMRDQVGALHSPCGKCILSSSVMALIASPTPALSRDQVTKKRTTNLDKPEDIGLVPGHGDNTHTNKDPRPPNDVPRLPRFIAAAEDSWQT